MGEGGGEVAVWAIVTCPRSFEAGGLHGSARG